MVGQDIPRSASPHSTMTDKGENKKGENKKEATRQCALSVLDTVVDGVEARAQNLQDGSTFDYMKAAARAQEMGKGLSRESSQDDEIYKELQLISRTALTNAGDDMASLSRVVMHELGYLVAKYPDKLVPSDFAERGVVLEPFLKELLLAGQRTAEEEEEAGATQDSKKEQRVEVAVPSGGTSGGWGITGASSSASPHSTMTDKEENRVASNGGWGTMTDKEENPKKRVASNGGWGATCSASKKRVETQTDQPHPPAPEQWVVDKGQQKALWEQVFPYVSNSITEQIAHQATFANKLLGRMEVVQNAIAGQGNNYGCVPLPP
jgi:hypothetical protein